MEKQKRDLVILGGILIVAILIGDWYLIMAPMFKGFSTKHQKISGLKNLIQEAESLKMQRDEIEKKLAEVEREFERYNKKLPQAKDIPALLAEFNKKAEEAGIKFAKVETLQTIPHTVGKNITYLERPLRVDVTSGYHEIGSFLNKIESLGRFVELKTMKLYIEETAAQKRENVLPIPKAEMTLSTYTFKESKPEGKLGQGGINPSKTTHPTVR